MRKIIVFTLKLLFMFLLILTIASKMSLFYAVFGKSEKEQDPDRLTSLFYYLPKDSVEVLFLGDSHSYCTYINQQIYDETGVTSASLATSAASPINSYWELKEALTRQSKIKMVVMETHPFEMSGDTVTENFMLHYTSGISMIPDFSLNKYLNFQDIKKHPYGMSESLSIYNVYSLFEFKEDYNRSLKATSDELKAIMFNPASLFLTFGYYPTSEITKLENLITYKNNQTYLDFSKTLEYEYLLKIYNLCVENDIEFVLSRAVYNREYDAHKYNEQIDEWAVENGVSLVNYFDLIDECEFDFETDFRDLDHFNYHGAKKATNYFIKNVMVEKNLFTESEVKNKKLWENNDYDYSVYD